VVRSERAQREGLLDLAPIAHVRDRVDLSVVEGAVVCVAAAPNLTRVIVGGETVGEWLRLEIDDDTPGVFTVAREGVG